MKKDILMCAVFCVVMSLLLTSCGETKKEEESSAVSDELSMTVRLSGTKDWSESVEAAIGDEVEFQIKYVNRRTKQVENVSIRDILPDSLQYVADTTWLYNSNYPEGVRIAENTLITSGINIANYSANGDAYVRFTCQVVDNNLAEGNTQLVNWASSSVNGEVVKDDASVMVSK